MNTWGDYDNDGDQDLYVCLSNYPGHINKLFRNDGDMDLFICSTGFENILYENRIAENNTFINVAGYYVINDSGATGGSNWFDYDNDGDLDLFIANNIDPNFPNLNTGSKIYRNEVNNNNGFIDVSDQIGIGDSITADGCTAGDYDLDGDIDLYIAARPGINKYFRNDINTNGLFTEIGILLNIADTLNTLNAVSGDYDNDGDLDIYSINFPREDCRLYRNNINLDNYLKIRILDLNGNYNRFGSNVKLYKAGTDSLVGMRMVDGGGNGGRAQNEYDCHFGLDPNQAYDIEVIFTTRTNGQNHVFNKHNRPELSGVIPSQIGHFLEIRDTVVTVTAIQPGEKPQTINRFKLYQNYPNPFNSTTIIPFQIEKTYKVKITIYDLTGKEVITLTDSPYQRGFYEIRWNGKNNEGGDVASGAYICHFFLNNKLQDVRKLFLVR